MRVAWARPARTQLSDILEYVSERNAKAASRIAIEAEQRTQSLAINPHLGLSGLEKLGQVAGAVHDADDLDRVSIEPV